MNRFMMMAVVVVMLAAGGVAKSSSKELQEMVGKTEDQLRADHAGTLSSITKIKNPGFLEMRPWYVWMFTNQKKEARYVVFSGKRMGFCPNQSEASVILLSSAGEELGRWNFSTGWRIELKSAHLNYDERLQAQRISIETEPVKPNGRDITKQYFAIVNDSLYFVRMENSDGSLKRNIYEGPGEAFGGSLPAKTVSEWTSLLESPHTALRLAALTYVAGAHKDPNHPDRWGNVQRQGQLVEGFESVEDRTIARDFRLAEFTKKCIEEYRHSQNVWLKEAAELAATPIPKGPMMRSSWW
jgi:hypothetical protein